MSAVGRIVKAEIYRLEEYGFYCRRDGLDIIVLVTDAGPIEQQTTLKGTFTIGQTVEVKITRFVESKNEYRATIRLDDADAD